MIAQLSPNAGPILDKDDKRLAGECARFLYDSDRFVRPLTEMIIAKLALRPDDVLVDLGDCTEMYLVDIDKQVASNRPLFCVAPCEELLDRIPDQNRVRAICLNALAPLERPLSDAEVAAGSAEMETTFRDVQTGDFIDHFDYLTGIKE